MATRTLGIKYEIRGFKEASESLKRINLGIKRSLRFDKELTEQRISNSNKIAALEIANLERVEEQELNQLERAKAEYRSYLGEPQSQDFGWVYRDILSRIREYREVMRKGDLQAALRMGEELIGAISVAEDIYEELGNKQFTGRLGQLKRIRGEILRGDRGRGRVDVGLLAIANTEEAKELGLDFEALRKSAVLSSKQLSKFDRQLRNANERVSGFMEERDRILQTERTRLYVEGFRNQQGQQVIDLAVAELEREDIEIRIDKLIEEIKPIESALESPELAEGLRRVREAASVDNLFLLSDTVSRMLDEERDSTERLSIQGVQALTNFRNQLLQLQEQAIQNMQQTRENTLSLSRTIDDYFFELKQKLSEARIETERLLNELFYRDIKGQLRRAISPGSESFLNGIVDGIQSLLDQAQQVFEERLGLKTGRLELEGEIRSDEQEMRDFIKEIRGATDALGDFRNGLVGDTSTNNAGTRRTTSSSNAVNFPLPGLTLDSARITSGYGWRTLPKRGRDFHEGLDFAATGGTDVLAVRDGVISHIKPLADQMQVAVESVNASGQKVTEWFIHLGKNLDVAIGDRVSSGQKIGEVAFTTARARREQVSTGDHLDYRVMVNGQWVNPKTMLSNASTEQVINLSGSSSTLFDSNLVQDAISIAGTDVIAGNEATNEEKRKHADIQRILSEFGIEDLQFEIENQRASIAREFQLEGLESRNELADLEDKLAEILEKSQGQTAEVETQQKLRQAISEFRGYELEGFQALQGLADKLANLQGIVKVFPNVISKLKELGTTEALAVIPVLEDSLHEARASLPQVEEDYQRTKEIYQKILEERDKQLEQIKEEGRLLKILEDLRLRQERQQLVSEIAAKRGTVQQQKKNSLIEEEYRLKEKIANIEKDKGAGSEEAQELIDLEKRISEIKKQDIERNAYDQELAYEKQLLDLEGGADSKRADLLKGRGFELEANDIERENAIAQEYIRYDQEISRLEQEYAGDPDKLERLKRAAYELSQVNLLSIDQQFKDLGGTIEDIAFNEFQNFFTGLTTDINNVGDLALKMIGNVAQSIAQLFAKQASAQIFRLVFGSAVGGFSNGGTVANFEEGGTVERIVPTPISDRLREISAPIRNAFRREGRGGRLAVFTPGEEILSIKTGEAGRYQSLKREFGVNPLEKIFAGNFMGGGLIEANLLAGLDYSIPKINVSAIGERDRSTQEPTQNYYLSSTFVSPDVDSFKASEYQIQQEQLEQLRRMDGRR